MRSSRSFLVKPRARQPGKEDERVVFTLHSTGADAAEDGAADDEEQKTEYPDEPVQEGADDDAVRQKLPVESWIIREVALSEPLLGYLLTNTTRLLLVAPTGLGKTNLALAAAFAIAEGKPFLHWQGSGSI